MIIQNGLASEYTAGNIWIAKMQIDSEAYKIETLGNKYEVTSGKVKNFIRKSEFTSSAGYFEAIDKMIDTAYGSTWEFITDNDCYYVEIQLEDNSKIIDKVEYEDVYFC